MPANATDAKESFGLYDDVGDSKIDCLQIGDVCRALGLKPTQAQVHKAAGQEYKREGEKRLTFEEFFSNLRTTSKRKRSRNTSRFY